jgi:hypothetical protein
MAAAGLKITREVPEKGKGHAGTTLEVNGVNISNAVTSYTLTHHAGGIVECVVTLVVGTIAAEVGAENVRVDEGTAEALAALGWTPPIEEISDDDREDVEKALRCVDTHDCTSWDVAARVLAYEVRRLRGERES